MPPYNVETLINVGCLLVVLIFVVPRIWALFELNWLRMVTEQRIGKVAYTPAMIQSKQNLRTAAASVQRALSLHHRNFHYNIKVINVPDPIEQSIRVEGVTEINLSRKSTINSNFTGDQSKATSLMMTVRADVTQFGEGTKISWRYLPSDPGLFQSQIQIHDPNVDYLLARTNYVIMRQLKPLVG
jgi:hypothetical protein